MPVLHVLISKTLFDERIPDRDNCLYWRDDLSVGPVPSTSTLEKLSLIREAFWNAPTDLRRLAAEEAARAFEKLSEAGRLKHAKLMSGDRSLTDRDAKLRNVDGFSEIVVWCGQNRREVLMLSAILRFCITQPANVSRISIARCPGCGPASCNSTQLANAFFAREPIRPTTSSYLLKLWDAYTADNPALLNELIGSHSVPSTLPQRVLQWILEEYPSVETGLSWIEETLIRNSVEGRTVPHIVGETLTAIDGCLGDVLLFELIWNFLMSDDPLLKRFDGRPAAVATAGEFRGLAVVPTELGHQMLRGERCEIRLRRPSRWVGGVQLDKLATEWRLDRSQNHVVKTQPLA